MNAPGFDASFSSMIRQLPQKAVRRADAWINTLTSMGQVSDKAQNLVPVRFFGLDDEVLSDLFHSDPVVRKAVCKRPDDALKLGFRVAMPNEAGGHDLATTIQDRADDLDLVGQFRLALYWENLFGGSVLYVAVDDGQYGVDSQERPINREGLKSILWVRAVDRTRVRMSFEERDLDQDTSSPTYGEPLYFLIETRVGAQQKIRVHRSRVIVFPGAVCTDKERRRRHGWGLSVVEAIYEILQRNANAWTCAANAVGNAQYVIYKLKGLDKMFSLPGGEERAKSRARAMELAKSMINAVLIDSEDEYIRENPNFGNLPEMLDRFMLEVSSALDMPATILWGRSPAGLNATGESDLEHWYVSIEAYREHHLRPRFHSFLELLLLAKDSPTGGVVPEGWRVNFPGLKQLSDGEKAEIRERISRADEIDIRSGVLMPQEVATSRFRPEGYAPHDTHINLEVRERMLEAELALRELEIEQATDKIENPPPVPAAFAAQQATPGQPAPRGPGDEDSEEEAAQ